MNLDQILDKTVGPLTPDRSERRNIFWLTLSTMGMFGNSTLAALTILTAYLQKSGFSNTQIGYITGTSGMAATASLFVLMGFADRTQKRLRTAVICNLLIALFTLLLGLTSAVPRSLLPPAGLLVALIIVMSINSLPNALAGMMNYSVLVRTIRVEIRGRVWGTNYIATGVLTILLSMLASLLLKRWGYPLGYTFCFVLGAGFALLRALAFGRQTELPELSAPGTGRSALPFVAIVDMFRLKEFRAVAYPHVLRGLVIGAMGFIVPTQMARLSLSDVYAGYMTAVVSAAGLLGAFLLGMTLDRWGAGVVTLGGNIVTAICLVAIIVSPSPVWFLALFLLFNVGDVLEQRAIPLGSIEIVPPGIVGGFHAARLMILTGSSAAGSFLAGRLLDVHGQIMIFCIAAFLRLGLGFWFLEVFGRRRKPISCPEPATQMEPELSGSASSVGSEMAR